MKIIRLYADEKGESHFEDVEVKFEAPTKSGRVSERLPATGIIFRQVPGLTASDGETRRVKAGEVVLVEDTSGKGHLSKTLDGKIRHCIFVPID